MNDEVKRLSELVESSGLSCSAIGRLANIPKSTIQRLVAGQTEKYSTSIIKKLAQVLDVHPAYLACWQDEKGQYSPDRHCKAVAEEIFELANALPENLQKIALEQIRCLAALADDNNASLDR